MQPYILGIDIGTGSTKAVAMQITGETLASCQQYYTTQHPQPGYSEQDPKVIWQAFVTCIRDIVSKLRTPPAAIGLSCAMHSVIPVDRHGVALSPMITWADTRAENIAQRIKASAEGDDIYRATGTPIHPMSPLCKLIWLKENDAELFNIAHKFISIKEYIWFKLFNRFEVDHSVASGTGLFDIGKLTWNDAGLNLSGTNPSRLSTPVATGYTQTGLNTTIATLLNLPTTTPFVIGATDGCCANLGSYVTEPGTAALTIGTSGAVRITGNKPVYIADGMAFNYLLNEQTYISGGAVNNGGAAVDWLLKTFLNKTNLTPADYTNLFNIIEAVPAGSDGLLFLPYLYGERAPIWDANASGAYINIKSQHTQAHFLRAGLEGVCYALYNVLSGLEQASQPIVQINVSGGFISSPVWVQLLADVTGKDLMIVQNEDASALGAIFLAMRALYPGQQLPVSGKGTIVYPDKANHALYAKTLPLFKQLYADTKKSINALNQLSN